MVRPAGRLPELSPTETGEKIPILFRPIMNIPVVGFVGKNLCTPQEYKQLWSMTKDFLDSKGADHLLYAYSPPNQLYRRFYRTLSRK